MNQTTFEPILLQNLSAGTARPSVAPAAPLKRGSRARIRKAAVRILLLTAGAILVARAVSLATQPLVATFRAGRQIRSLEGRLAEEQARGQRLLADMAFLKTPAGVEEEARRQGWVRAGETAIQILGPETAIEKSDQLTK